MTLELDVLLRANLGCKPATNEGASVPVAATIPVISAPVLPLGLSSVPTASVISPFVTPVSSAGPRVTFPPSMAQFMNDPANLQAIQGFGQVMAMCHQNGGMLFLPGMFPFALPGAGTMPLQAPMAVTSFQTPMPQPSPFQPQLVCTMAPVNLASALNAAGPSRPPQATDPQVTPDRHCVSIESDDGEWDISRAHKKKKGKNIRLATSRNSAFERLGDREEGQRKSAKQRLGQSVAHVSAFARLGEVREAEPARTRRSRSNRQEPARTRASHQKGEAESQPRLPVANRLTIPNDRVQQMEAKLERLEKKVGEKNDRDKPLVGSPFTTRVHLTPFPRKVKIDAPRFTGKEDPEIHLDSFNQSATMNGCTDEEKCLLFFQTLRSRATEWFNKLRPGSIDSFSDLASKFKAKFQENCTKRKKFTYLSTAGQRESENLTQFLTQWKEEEFCRKPPATYQEAYHTAWEFAEAEAQLRAKREAEHGHKPKPVQVKKEEAPGPSRPRHHYDPVIRVVNTEECQEVRKAPVIPPENPTGQKMDLQRTNVHPGPINNDVLVLGPGEHRCDKVWQDRAFADVLLKCVKYYGSLHEGLGVDRHRRVTGILREYGFYGVEKISKLQIDWALITALVDRWRPETHAFHLPFGEVGITLQDVEVLLGLPVNGTPVVGSAERTKAYWVQLCEDMMGFRPDLVDLTKTQIKMTAITFIGLTYHSVEVDFIQHTRALMLKIMGGALFSSTTGNKVNLFLIELLMGTTQEVRSRAIGVAVLACLYRNLCNAALANTAQIAGPLVLLQVWAWERIPTCRPQGMLLPHDVAGAAYGARWVCSHRWTASSAHSIRLYRDQLDRLQESEFIWTPYPELHDLHPDCYAGIGVWRAHVPLIYTYMVEMHYPDRFSRQFGGLQDIPEAVERLIGNPEHRADFVPGYVPISPDIHCLLFSMLDIARVSDVDLLGPAPDMYALAHDVHKRAVQSIRAAGYGQMLSHPAEAPMYDPVVVPRRHDRRRDAPDHGISLHNRVKRSGPLSRAPPGAFGIQRVSSRGLVHTRLERRELWDSIRSLFPRSDPWIIGGDFNKVASISEHKGPICPDIGSIEDFTQTISDRELVFPPFLGNSFTWFGKRGRGNVCRRLDRVLVNEGCMDWFQSLKIRHLGRGKSNHMPILLRLQNLPTTGQKPFRFLNVRRSRATFQELLQSSWDKRYDGGGMRGMADKLHHLKKGLLKWNKETFENIFEEMSKAETRAEKAEADFDLDDCEANFMEFKLSRALLQQAHKKEEAFWTQKANIKWISQGDASTSFFHAFVKGRRKRLHISSLKTSNGITSSLDGISRAAIDQIQKHDPFCKQDRLLSTSPTSHSVVEVTVEGGRFATFWLLIFHLYVQSTMEKSGRRIKLKMDRVTKIQATRTRGPGNNQF
ncbi:unnamed protein product [Cuscuta campestris]|uniref:Uncharacterized protein n=1 Tax=Cuscuta campestris TaxID=132261 RepID=A0A484LRP8_9ASTE|nr:unnamed protein product [Cuscuta campestris]